MKGFNEYFKGGFSQIFYVLFYYEVVIVLIIIQVGKCVYVVWVMIFIIIYVISYFQCIYYMYMYSVFRIGDEIWCECMYVCMYYILEVLKFYVYMFLDFFNIDLKIGFSLLFVDLEILYLWW